MKTTRFTAFCFLVLGINFLFIQPAFAKDEWLNVRSKNFNLIGNASDKDIRKVATKLEQFREAFRLLFTGSNLSSPIPTNVVVFKSDSAYKPFKPKRQDGKTDNFIAGYFQPGEDVNYITLSTGGEDAETYGTIFHEYVHFIVNTNIGKSDVPQWFKEGLAEYYQTFEMEGDIKAKLGLPQTNHLLLLQQNKLIPLNQFFNIGNSALSQTGGHSRSIFYAQAWALIHYFVANKKTEEMSKFLLLSMKNVAEEKAFQDAFKLSYAQMEKELKQYVAKGSYMYTNVTFSNKLSFDLEMQSKPLTEAETNAYMGDLLYHTNRADDAEPYLKTALTLDPDSSMANTTLGVVKIRQRKFDEAKVYLDKAISKDQKNHIAYYRYAYLLSREGRDEFGFVNSFPAEKTAKMRELLKKAIQINPSFAESYEMLAFISLVDNDRLDEGVAAMQKAQTLQPGNQRYALRIAELYSRQEKYDQAVAIAEKVAKTADEPEIKKQADNLMDQVRQRKEILALNEESRKKYEAAIAAGAKDGGTRPLLRRGGSGDKMPTPEETARAEQEFTVRAINRELRKTGAEEIRLLGYLEKIRCPAGTVVYNVKGEAESFILTSKDFQGLNLASYITDGGDAEVGCEAKVAAIKAVLTYRPKTAAKNASRGELISVEFVPAHFRFVDAVSEAADQPPPFTETVVTTSVPEGFTPPAKTQDDYEGERRNSMMQHIKDSIRKPAAGEKQELALIEKSECSNKGMFFYFKTPTQVLKLTNPTTGKFEMRAFTPDVEHLQIGCGMKAVEVPVVITYTDLPDKKSKSNGTLIALDFVPKSFALSQ
ncbi:MAG: tetratricopeptide repeat protein [Saprospiraceae bacterium]|nr:tetratricopeptide repeat protein [Pyrinomonadaceae bacterium]